MSVPPPPYDFAAGPPIGQHTGATDGLQIAHKRPGVPSMQTMLAVAGKPFSRAQAEPNTESFAPDDQSQRLKLAHLGANVQPNTLRPLIVYQGPDGQIPLGEPGMFGYIAGQAGVGKTATLHALAAAALGPGLNDPAALNFRLAAVDEADIRPVLIVNMETTRDDFTRGVARICRILQKHPSPAYRPEPISDTGFKLPERLQAYDLSGFDPATVLDDLEYLIRKIDPCLVLFDGWADLVRNVNDPDECSELMRWAKAMTRPLEGEKMGRVLCGILHDNEGKEGFGKARGHLGSELQRQSRFALEMKRCKHTQEPTLGVRKASHGRANLPPAQLAYNETKGYFEAVGWGQDEHGLTPQAKGTTPRPEAADSVPIRSDSGKKSERKIGTERNRKIGTERNRKTERNGTGKRNGTEQRAEQLLDIFRRTGQWHNIQKVKELFGIRSADSASKALQLAKRLAGQNDPGFRSDLDPGFRSDFEQSEYSGRSAPPPKGGGGAETGTEKRNGKTERNGTEYPPESEPPNPPPLGPTGTNSPPPTP